MDKGPTLLEVKNLKTTFKGEGGMIEAVNDISFTVRKGETVGIVGESGSGKSVTALSIMQLISQPSLTKIDGEILFNSSIFGTVNLARLPRSKMRQIRGEDIAMIFQEPMSSLNPVFTCGHQVREAILQHRNISRIEARSRTLELLSDVQINNPEEVYKAFPHE